MHSLYRFFVRVAYVRGSVRLQTWMIGHIACRRERGDGRAQHGRSVIYDCLAVETVLQMIVSQNSLLLF